MASLLISSAELVELATEVLLHGNFKVLDKDLREVDLSAALLELPLLVVELGRRRPRYLVVYEEDSSFVWFLLYGVLAQHRPCFEIGGFCFEEVASWDARRVWLRRSGKEDLFVEVQTDHRFSAKLLGAALDKLAPVYKPGEVDVYVSEVISAPEGFDEWMVFEKLERGAKLIGLPSLQVWKVERVFTAKELGEDSGMAEDELLVEAKSGAALLTFLYTGYVVVYDLKHTFGLV